MLCSLCGKKESTVEFEGLINGKAVKFYLCDDCMKGIDIESALSRTHFSAEDFLAALSESMEKPVGQEQPGDHCPACGMSFEEFSRTNSPGCPQCRRAFSSRLKPLLRKANASNKEAAIRSAAAAVQESRTKELEILQIELKKAVKLEEYEQAAVLRDKIKEMEK